MKNLNTNESKSGLVSRPVSVELLQAELHRNFDFELTQAQVDVILLMQGERSVAAHA